MAKFTDERVLTAAPEIFSQKGYEGTNIRELSASLGLLKSGIHKHFESKKAIRDGDELNFSSRPRDASLAEGGVQCCFGDVSVL